MYFVTNYVCMYVCIIVLKKVLKRYRYRQTLIAELGAACRICC